MGNVRAWLCVALIAGCGGTERAPIVGDPNEDSASIDSAIEDTTPAPDGGSIDSAPTDSVTSPDTARTDDTATTPDTATAPDTMVAVDSTAPDTKPPPDTSTCACSPGQVCCSAPLPCAGMCVPDCRLGGSCPSMLTCSSSSGVCVPADAGVADTGMPPMDSGMPPMDSGMPMDSGSTDTGSVSDTSCSSTPPTGAGVAEMKLPGTSAWTPQFSSNDLTIDGDTAAVGYEGISGSLAGSVTVSTWNCTTSAWEQQQVVKGTGSADDDMFGSSVSLSGDSLVVGANYRPGSGGSSGGAYAFSRSGTTWTQFQNITAPTGAYARWGYAIGQSGGTLAISGPLGKDPSSTVTYTGVIEILTKAPSGMWTARAMLVPSTAAYLDAFGYSLAIDGGTIIGGAPGALNFPAAVSRQGKAWIFTGSGTTWTEAAALTASDGASGDWFGRSVALSGTLAIVGAPNHDSAGSNAGAAYIFTNSGGTWTQTAKLTASDATTDANFGFTVAALSSTRVAVGASGAGKVYTFTLSGGVWTQDGGTFSACSGAVGFALATSGNLLLSGKTAGRVFDLADPTRTCVP